MSARRGRGLSRGAGPPPASRHPSTSQAGRGADGTPRIQSRSSSSRNTSSSQSPARRSGLFQASSSSQPPAVATLMRHVATLPIPEHQAAQLEEEMEMDAVQDRQDENVAHREAEEATEESLLVHQLESDKEDEEVIPSSSRRNPASVPILPSPGVPIPIFTVSSWTSPWRTEFFTDWRHDPASKKIYALCKQEGCPRSRKYLSADASSFSNIKKHLVGLHKSLLDAFEQKQKEKPADPNQSTITTFTRPTMMTKAKQVRLNNLLGYCLAVDNIPINVLRRPYFRKWIAEGMLGYKLPWPETMRNSILPSLVMQLRMKIVEILSNCSALSLILDIWSSRMMMGFLGFVVCGVNNDFSRFNIFLAIKKMHGRHTAQNILAEFDQILKEWSVPRHKVVQVKTDAGSAMVAASFENCIPGWDKEVESPSADVLPAALGAVLDAVAAQSTSDEEDMVEIELVGDADEDIWATLEEAGLSASEFINNDDIEELESVELGLESLMPSSSRPPTALSPVQSTHYELVTRLRSDCAVHKLQLVIKDGFNEMDAPAIAAISKASKLVNYVRKSTLDSETVLASVGFRLPAKNATRWNSQYYMLSKLTQALDMDPSLQQKLNACKSRNIGILSAYEIQVLKEIVAILRPFEIASDDFQADFETIGNVIPAFLALKNVLTLTVKDRNGIDIPNPASRLASTIQTCKAFVNALHESLIRRFSFVLTDACYVLGTVLDPRFKKNWIRSTEFSEVDVLDAVKLEIESRYKASREWESSSPLRDSTIPVGANGTTADERVGRPQHSRKRRNSDSLYASVLEVPRPASVGPEKILKEFDDYIQERCVPMESPSDPSNPDEDLHATKPLEYWKVNAQLRFQLLSGVARDCLAAAASSGSVERCFSTATDILSAKRAGMKPDLFSDFMFIKCNSRLNSILNL